MATATASAKWPDVGEVPQWLKNWLDDFYALADTQGDEASRKFAAHFAEDGVQYGLGGPLRGREAIVQARAPGWKPMDWRKHEVLQIFTARRDYSDVLVQGRITAVFKNKQEVSGEFAVQIVFDDVSAPEPKAVLYKNWSVSVNLIINRRQKLSC
ncbi:hypothetical protein FOPE_08352 [Fonsecaea pedrosoi]|nr:hypothetical protein FOPE_08352 [Fonsecaea pedrosoi]